MTFMVKQLAQISYDHSVESIQVNRDTKSGDYFGTKFNTKYESRKYQFQNCDEHCVGYYIPI